MAIISILTPAWNRIRGLKKLYASLEAQSTKDFVWIVADDGSKDGTLEWLQEVRNSASFQIRIICSNVRVGKAVLDNRLINSVCTEYYINCDSDDWLVPNAIQLFIAECANYLTVHNTYPDLLMALNLSDDGKPQTISQMTGSMDDLASSIMNRLRGDATMMLRKSYFQKLYHLEVDFVVTEALAYGNLFNGARTRFLKKYIKIMNRSESNSISYTKGIRYCRGSAFAMHGHITKKFCRNFEETFTKELYMDLILLARYAFNGDLGSRFIRETVPSSVHVFFLRAAMFIGYLFSLRDRISGGLEKTHKEFDKNIKIASIYCLL